MLRSSEQRARITWFNVRRGIGKELKDLNNPYAWSKLLLMIIDNKIRMPKNRKGPMIYEILEAFEAISINHLGSGYLSTVFHDADVREHQGTGERMVLMRKAFEGLKSISESKLLNPSRESSRVRSQPIQLELGLALPQPKRDKPVKHVPIPVLKE